MQIPILIERIDGIGYRARGGEPFVVSADGPTREAALSNLKQQIKARLGNGAEIVALDVTPELHPLAEFAGMFKDDPLIEEWKQSMAEYRRNADRGSDFQ